MKTKKGTFDDSFKYTTGDDWDFQIEAAKEDAVEIIFKDRRTKRNEM